MKFIIVYHQKVGKYLGGIKIGIGFCLLLISYDCFGGDPVRAVPFPIDSKLPEARESEYSARLPKVLKKWPLKDIPEAPVKGNPIWMRAIRTPGKDSMIGIEKRAFISAPLKRVVGLLDKFEDYPSRDEGLDSVAVTRRENNKVTTEWKRKSPVKLLFISLVPSIVYQQVYLVDRPTENRVIYRFQLISSESANTSDGLMILEGDDHSTVLTSFDFYDGKWGIASVALDTVWHEILKNVYRGDLMLKIQAEHPDWNFDRIKEMTARMMAQYRDDSIVYLQSPDQAGL